MKSNEAITQGDPVSMEIYGIGVIWLIKMLLSIAVIPTKTRFVC